MIQFFFTTLPIFFFSLVSSLIFSNVAHSAVILQYHHVSDTTPKSTSVSPAQFEKHLAFLSQQAFNVVPLSTIIEAVKNGKTLPDKTVAITFDDGYSNNLTYAKPLLDKYNFPFTIFINPAVINRKSSYFLSWQQLKALSDEGVIIANHGLEHDSFAKTPKGKTPEQWLAEKGQSLITAEEIIKQHTGKSWRYFAYPYGEFTEQAQQWLLTNNFIALGQQSGAVGLSTDLTSIPRFPASQPYDTLEILHDKLYSLALTIKPVNESAKILIDFGEISSATFEVESDDFDIKRFNCYISGLGRQELAWQNTKIFTIKFSENLPLGRVRANCTAPSNEHKGRFYWYSKQWVVLSNNVK